MDAIEFDVTKQLDTFNKLANDMPFIVSKAMNDVAFKHGRKAVSKNIHKNMEIRNKSFANVNSIRVRRASKNNLQVELYHFKEQMGLQQFGGVELPKSRKIAVPIRRNLATYAGVPMNKSIPKGLSIGRIMDKAPRKKGQTVYKTKGIKPFVGRKGVYIRTGEGIRLLYAFIDKAVHSKKLLQFQSVIEHTYNVKLERSIEHNYLKILKG